MDFPSHWAKIPFSFFEYNVGSWLIRILWSGALSVDVTLFFERLGIMFMFIQFFVVLDSLHYDWPPGSTEVGNTDMWIKHTWPFSFFEYNVGSWLIRILWSGALSVDVTLFFESLGIMFMFIQFFCCPWFTALWLTPRVNWSWKHRYVNKTYLSSLLWWTVFIFWVFESDRTDHSDKDVFKVQMYILSIHGVFSKFPDGL